MYQRTDAESYNEPAKNISYLTVLSVGAIQILLSPIFYCYGIFLTEFNLYNFYTIEQGVWTLMVFAISSKITYSWTVTYCQFISHCQNSIKKLKRNICFCSCFLFSIFFLISFISSMICQILIYGIFGGLLTTIISVHLKFIIEQIDSNQSSLFDSTENICKPLSILLASFPIFFLIQLYGALNVEFIFSALVLNIIPACLIIRSKVIVKCKPLYKFQTVERLSTEMCELNVKRQSESEESSSSEDENESETSMIHTSGEPLIETSSIVHAYPENVAGVKILPRIPEENETEDEDDINEINLKRLSKISAKLQELNEIHRRDVTSSINNLYQPDDNIEIVVTADETYCVEPCTFTEFNEIRRRRFSIISHLHSCCKTVFSNKFFKEYFVKAFLRAFGRSFYIYPSMISTSVTSLMYTIFFATTSSIAIHKSHQAASIITDFEGNILLNITAFGWLLFIAIYYAGVSKISLMKIRWLFLIGLSICGLSIFLLQTFTNDNLILSCLLFGLGHGIVSNTENLVLKDFYGERWRKEEAYLEITTGFLVILIYFIIYSCNLKIDVLLAYAHWLYFFDVLLWIFAFILKYLYFKVKDTRHHHFNFYYSNVMN